MKTFDKMTEQMRFKKSVLLVDARFLLEDVADIKKQLAQRMGVPENPGDLVQLFTLLGMDAGLGGGRQDGLQVILLRPSLRQKEAMPLEPAQIASLDGMATSTPLGEMSFMVLDLDEKFSMADLYHDVLGLALEAEEVEDLLLLPLASSAGGVRLQLDVYSGLVKDMELKMPPAKTVLFDLFQEPGAMMRQLPLAAPLAYALGYRAV